MKKIGTAVVIGCLLAVNGGAQSVGTLLDEGFSEPYGIAVDSDNFYYITDSVKNRILQYLPNTGALTNYVGMEGIIGNQDGVGSFASFFNPQGILSITNANNQARLIVADSGNHRIRSITLKVEDLDNTPEDESDSGKLVEALAGSLTREVGLRDGIGEEALFNFPVGLAVDKDKNIYVADMLNHKIRKIDVNNRVTTLPVGGFSQPSDVAVDEDGNIYVADSGNNAIKMIDPSGESVRLIAGSGTRFLSGAKDALNAENSTFNSPRGLLWVGGRSGLLVSDSGNGLLRRVFFNTEFDVYTTQTFANSGEAEMVSPIGLAEDNSGNFIIVDLGGESLRVILVSGVPQPRVQDPVIGFIDLFDEGFFGNVLIAVTNATFNNDVIAAVRTEEGIQTFYEVGVTDLQNEVPDPTTESDVPGRYENSMARASFPPNLIDPIQRDVTIKAISTQADRRPSRIIVARYRFVAANPVVVGNNMASFAMRTITTNASIWFTTNGDDPVPDPNIARPYTLGEKLNVVNGTNDVIFKARAFKGGYASSSIIEKFFLHEDARFSTIGFSSDFMAGIGSTIVVPINVNVLTNDTIRSLQYRVQVTPETEGAPPVIGGFRVLSRQSSDFISVPVPGVGGSNISSFLPYSFSDVQGLAVSFIGTNSLLNIVE
ncbi:MAG TPA: hypothetical protein EYG38_21075, partial [Verrucomicrobia bacterium]|nr:hypothetical protein [Verrucomicrobiota bacterium]